MNIQQATDTLIEAEVDYTKFTVSQLIFKAKMVRTANRKIKAKQKKVHEVVEVNANVHYTRCAG